MNHERSGIDALHEAIESVAVELERREALPTAAPPRSFHAVAAWAATAAAIVLAAAGLWIARPAPTPEVEILEMKIHGRPVQAIVIDNRAPGTLVVLAGDERAGRGATTPAVGLAVLIGGTR